MYAVLTQDFTFIETFLQLKPLQQNYSLNIPYLVDGIKTGYYLNICFGTFSIKPATYLL